MSRLKYKRIRLRGHHLICLCFFIGKGYSLEFTNNMFEILKYLKNNFTEKLVEVVFNFDDLCKCCPKQFCQVDSKTDEYLKLDYLNFKNCSNHDSLVRDESCLSVLKFKIGNFISFDEIISAKNKYFNNEVFLKICGNCRWFDLCKFVRESKNI